MVQFQSTVSNQMTFTITEQQYMAAMLLHSRRQLRMMPLIFSILVLSLGLMTFSVTVALTALVFFLAYMGLIAYLIRKNIKKQFQSLPQLHCDQTIQFSEEGIVWHNNYALSKVKWPLYQKYAVDENLYLLYQGPHLFNLIPRSAFHSEEQETAFRMILELNVKPAAPPKRRKQV